MLHNKIILIFGGTGSLGHELNERYLENNTIYNFSRDEHKHWEMNINFNYNTNMKFIVGNVSNKERVRESISRVNPNIIIIASAMKHIDQCEINTNESLNTNLLGTKNIIDSVEELQSTLTNLETVLFVSSDKACNPINNYGMCKALSETLIIEKAFYLKKYKFINVRYGNVLNSSGSIIPRLHLMGNNDKYTHFYLTHEIMTRFIMTLKDSVDLIEHAILHGQSGDIVISELKSMKIIDLMSIFSEKYNKPIKITGLRAGEKLLETLINETQSGRIIKNDKYTHIQSTHEFKNPIEVNNLLDYNSNINSLSKSELYDNLLDLGLI
jgi:FlaA1/EpsC-like NDP-sugar epimerase